MSYRWPEHRLGDVCSIASDFVDPKDAAYCDLPHVGGANMQSGADVLVDVKSASEEKLISGKFAFNQDVVLYSKIRPYLRKVARPKFHGLCSADIYPLTPRADRIIRDYLYYLLISEDFTAYAEQGSARSGMPKVNREHLFDFRFRLPPLAEQRRIVAMLDEAFAGIAAGIAMAQRNRASALAYFSQVSDAAFELRKDWHTSPLADLGQLTTGSTPKSSSEGSYGGETPFIKPGDFRPDGTLNYDNDSLTESGLRESRLMPAGSPLMVCIGATIGKTGYAERDVAANQQVNAFSAGSKVNSRFVFHQMRASRFQAAVMRDAAQATLPIISKSKWGALPIAYPSWVEQERIATMLDRLRVEVDCLAAVYVRKLALLAELKQSLLARAFSGELTREPLAA